MSEVEQTMLILGHKIKSNKLVNIFVGQNHEKKRAILGHIAAEHVMVDSRANPYNFLDIKYYTRELSSGYDIFNVFFKGINQEYISVKAIAYCSYLCATLNQHEAAYIESFDLDLHPSILETVLNNILVYIKQKHGKLYISTNSLEMISGIMNTGIIKESESIQMYRIENDDLIGLSYNDIFIALKHNWDYI